MNNSEVPLPSWSCGPASYKSFGNYVFDTSQLVERLFFPLFLWTTSMSFQLCTIIMISAYVSVTILSMWVGCHSNWGLWMKSFKLPILIRSSILSFKTLHSLVECPRFLWYWQCFEKSALVVKSWICWHWDWYIVHIEAPWVVDPYASPP